MSEAKTEFEIRRDELLAQIPDEVARYHTCKGMNWGREYGRQEAAEIIDKCNRYFTSMDLPSHCITLSEVGKLRKELKQALENFKGESGDEGEL